MIRRFVELQRSLSRAFDRRLPEKYRVDGNMHFRNALVPALLRPGMRICDVGSGKHPFLETERKLELRAHVTGLDISAQELAAAPAGAYDDVIVSDIASIPPGGAYDLVVCQSVLEHVRDVDGAFGAIAGMLRSGGVVATFCPSRYAPFALVNRWLPERVKLKLLHGLFPETKDGYGFPAYYDRCTPASFRHLATKHGLVVEELGCFYKSSYLSFFFPFHVLYRTWNLLAGGLVGEAGAETFALVARKASLPPSEP